MMKRYRVLYSKRIDICKQPIDPNGEWVKYDDAAKLEAEIAELKEELEARIAEIEKVKAQWKNIEDFLTDVKADAIREMALALDGDDSKKAGTPFGVDIPYEAIMQYADKLKDK